MNKIKQDKDILIFNCPQCQEEIIVLKKEINCAIFRHAVYKKKFEQINPHTSKNECQRLIDSDLVFGCAKPFQIINKNGELFAAICDYI